MDRGGKCRLVLLAEECTCMIVMQRTLIVVIVKKRGGIKIVEL